MSMYAAGNQVKVNLSVLEDPSHEKNHHLFQEALKHDVTGVVVKLDSKRSTPQEFWYRVQFHFFTAPLKEDHIIG